jgi:hypothetical protein
MKKNDTLEELCLEHFVGSSVFYRGFRMKHSDPTKQIVPTALSYNMKRANIQMSKTQYD